ncbi:MAG: insulinase family protein [Rhodobacteraceae bacterium]|nr:insulinase family protein [Paracoccaceae bacterium]
MIRALLAAALAAVLALPVRAAVEIQEVTSPGGITAWLVEEHSIPFVALDIRFKGGTSLDAPGKRGAINLMTALLEEGAAERDAQGFAAEAEALAARFRFEAYDDTILVSASVLTENREAALELLRTALVAPRFDPDAVERVRAQVIANIRSDATDPNAIAGRRFDEIAFGDHPYATSGDGTIESVTALTRDDLIAAKDRVMARDRVFVGAVGDITAGELGALLDRLLGDLPQTGAPMPERAEVTLTGGVHVVDFDTPQSVVVFGQKGIGRFDPDFFPAFVLDQILGGSGFGSRLMTEVREKRGLTYGIGTYLANFNLADLYLGQFASANDRVAEAIGVVRAEWARAVEGVTAEELERAKTYLTGAYPLRFDGNATIAGLLSGMQSEGLPIDYVENRNAYIEAVTLEDVRRVAARLLDPEALTFVVVGRPEGLEAGDPAN